MGRFEIDSLGFEGARVLVVGKKRGVAGGGGDVRRYRSVAGRSFSRSGGFVWLPSYDNRVRGMGRVTWCTADTSRGRSVTLGWVF